MSLACPKCGSTQLRRGSFAPTHPDDIASVPEGTKRDRKCEVCGEAFDKEAAVDA